MKNLKLEELETKKLNPKLLKGLRIEVEGIQDIVEVEIPYNLRK